MIWSVEWAYAAPCSTPFGSCRRRVEAVGRQIGGQLRIGGATVAAASRRDKQCSRFSEAGDVVVVSVEAFVVHRVASSPRIF